MGRRYRLRPYADRSRKRFYKRNVRSDIRTRVLDDVKCEVVIYLVLSYRGKRPIDYPDQGSP